MTIPYILWMLGLILITASLQTLWPATIPCGVWFWAGWIVSGLTYLMFKQAPL